MNATRHILFFLLWLLLTALSAFPQSRFKVGISMGQVYPLDDFRSTDLSLSGAGFAQNGFTLNVDADYMLHNRVSLSAKFHFGNAPIDKKEFQGWMEAELGNHFPADDTIQYDINFWQWATPMVGLKYNYPLLMHKIYIEAGVFTGISFNQVPNQNLLYHDRENERYLVSENLEKTTLSVPVHATAGFRFRVNDSIELKAEAGWFLTKQKFQHVSYYLRGEEVTEIKKSPMEISLNTLNASVGLIYRL